MSGLYFLGGTGPSSGPQSVVTCDDDREKTMFLSCATHHCKCSVTFPPQAERLSCVYENSLEKSTLYKHSGPLDLSMLGMSISIYPAVLTGLGLISLSVQLDGLSSRQEMLLSAPNQDCLPVGADKKLLYWVYDQYMSVTLLLIMCVVICNFWKTKCWVF